MPSNVTIPAARRRRILTAAALSPELDVRQLADELGLDWQLVDAALALAGVRPIKSTAPRA